jgi:fructose/tagatose bisphosphate aldolase
MPLVPGSLLLEVAHTYGFAVPAFRVRTPEVLLAVLEVVREEESPVFLHVPADLVRSGRGDLLADFARSAVDRLGVFASLHAEGVSDLSTLVLALRMGFTSVGLECSGSYARSLDFARRAVSLCTPLDVSVEADADWKDAPGGPPDSALEFLRRTGVSALQVRPEEVALLKGYLNVPLVVGDIPSLYGDHLSEIRRTGGVPEERRGVSDEDLRELVEAGANRILTAEDITLAFNAGLRTYVEEGGLRDPEGALRPALERVKEVVLRRVRVCGGSGRSSLL